MQKKSIWIAMYAALIMVGGLIGYFKAQSFPSLIAGTSTALLLGACSYFVWQKNQLAYLFTEVIAFSLFSFFGYRFITSYKFMPGGLMTICSAVLLTYLVMSKKQNNQTSLS